MFMVEFHGLPPVIGCEWVQTDGDYYLEGKISFSTLQESERAPDFFDFASVEFIELSLPEV